MTLLCFISLVAKRDIPIGTVTARRRNGIVMKFYCNEKEKLILGFIFTLKPEKPKMRPRTNKIAFTTIAESTIISEEGNLS